MTRRVALEDVAELAYVALFPSPAAALEHAEVHAADVAGWHGVDRWIQLAALAVIGGAARRPA